MYRSVVLFMTAIVVLTFAGVALTKTIVGTARNDQLRGTPAADRIDGRAGNDRIFGLGGNDRLVGGPGNDQIAGGKGNDVIVAGPGADKITCGPGDDRVSGDQADTASDDCEHVTGLTPPPLATEGHYAAPGNWFTFEVGAGGRTINGLFVRLLIPCASGIRISLPTTVAVVYPIKEDRTFVVEYSGNDSFQTHLSVAGRFDGESASGTLRLTATLAGSSCGGSLPWNATRV